MVCQFHVMVCRRTAEVPSLRLNTPAHLLRPSHLCLQVLHTLTGHSDAVSCVACSPLDETTAVSTGEDRCIKVLGTTGAAAAYPPNPQTQYKMRREVLPSRCVLAAFVMACISFSTNMQLQTRSQAVSAHQYSSFTCNCSSNIPTNYELRCHKPGTMAHCLLCAAGLGPGQGF
jgi:WD40 repeat protein